MMRRWACSPAGGWYHPRAHGRKTPGSPRNRGGEAGRSRGQSSPSLLLHLHLEPGLPTCGPRSVLGDRPVTDKPTQAGPGPTRSRAGGLAEALGEPPPRALARCHLALPSPSWVWGLSEPRGGRAGPCGRGSVGGGGREQEGRGEEALSTSPGQGWWGGGPRLPPVGGRGS